MVRVDFQQQGKTRSQQIFHLTNTWKCVTIHECPFKFASQNTKTKEIASGQNQKQEAETRRNRNLECGCSSCGASMGPVPHLGALFHGNALKGTMKSLESRSWRDGSAVESTSFSEDQGTFSSTWQLPTTCNSSSRGSGALFWPPRHQAHTHYTNWHIDQTFQHINKNKKS